MTTQLPPGFVLDDPDPAGASQAARLPPGFVLDDDAPTPSAEGSGGFMNATAGINEAIYNTLGAPVDLAAGAINLGARGINALTGSEIPTLDDPVGGSRSIARAFGAVGVPNPEDVRSVSPGEKLARGVGQGIGYTLAPEMAVRGAAQAMGRAVNPYLEALVGGSRSAGDAAANAFVGGAAGGGANVAGQIVPEEYRGTAELTGGLVGGGAAALAAAAPALVRGGVRMAGDYLAPTTTAGQERLAATAFREASEDPAALRAMLEDQPQPLVPGSQPTTFQQTGDMGLGQLERRLETANPTPFQQRRAEQNSARLGAMEGLQPTGSPEAVVNTLRQNLADIEHMTGDELAGATATARERTAAMGGAGTPEGYGATIRQQLDSARNSAKARERELWGAVDPDGTLALDAGGIRQAWTGILRELPKAAKPMEGEERAIFEVAARMNGAQPFREVTALRSRVSDALRQELSTNGQSQVYRRLSQLRGAIEDALEGAVTTRVGQEAEAVASGALDPDATIAANVMRQVNEWRSRQAATEAGRAHAESAGGAGAAYAPSMPSGSGSRGQGQRGFSDVAGDPRLQGDAGGTAFDLEAYDRLRQASAATQARAQTYDTGPVGDVLARSGSQGPFNAPAAVVPERFFRRGAMGAEGMRALQQAANTPETMATIRDYAVSNLRRFAEKPDGTLDPAKVTVWRKSHADALRAMPEVDRMLSGPVEAAEAVANLTVARKQAMDDYQAGAVARLIGLDDAADITRAVGAVFDARNPVQLLRQLASQTAGNADAKAGLRKAVADHLVQRLRSNTEAATSGTAALKSDAFQTFVTKNEAALKEVLAPAEVSMLKAIAADLQQANRSIASTKLPGRSNTAQDAIAQAKAAGGVRSWLTHLAAPLARASAGTAAAGPVGGVAAYVAGEALDKLRRAGLERVDDLLTDAILNPGRAMLLLSNAPPKPTAKDVATFAERYRRAASAAAIQARDGEPQPLRVRVP